VEKAKAVVMKFLLNKFVLGWLVKMFQKLTGWRTETSAIVVAALTVAYVMGFVPEDVYQPVVAAVGGFGGFAFLDKLLGYKDIFDKVADEIKKESGKANGGV